MTLCRLNSFLDNVDVGELVVRGDLEAFSCKFTAKKARNSKMLLQTCCVPLVVVGGGRGVGGAYCCVV